ncbi:hypothetical protein FRC01_003698, partial [Tulasnella sp. 417]
STPGVERMDYISQLPPDLLIPIILLVLDKLHHPGLKITRVEELRLVSRAWKTIIDSTPLFWTCIVNKPRSSPERIQGWLRKSGEAPLHIYSSSGTEDLEVFMSLVTPHLHRWRTLDIRNYSGDISTHIKEPAPMLATLNIYLGSLSADILVFGGVAPPLSYVSLTMVTVSQNPPFLRNLRYLRLQRMTYRQPDPTLTQLHEILCNCPDLEKLAIDAVYNPESSLARRQPVLLAKLSSFSLDELRSPPEIAEAIFGLIIAPRLALVSLTFTGYFVWRGMNILSPLSTELLLQHNKYNISIGDNLIQIKPIIEGSGSSVALPRVVVNLPPSGVEGGLALQLMEDVGKTASLSAVIDVKITYFYPAELIVNYLKSTIERVDGSRGHPLPGLRSIQMGMQLRQYPFSTWGDLLIDLAQARPDIQSLKISVTEGSSFFVTSFFKWDRAKVILRRGRLSDEGAFSRRRAILCNE